MRFVILVLGGALLALGIVEIGQVTWLAWIDVGVGIFTMLEAFFAMRGGRAVSIGLQVLLGLGGLALWIIALAVNTFAWAAWLNFAYGVLMLLSAFALAPRGRAGSPPVARV